MRLRHRTRRRIRRFAPLLRLVVLLVAVLAVGGALLAFQAWRARTELVQARDAIEVVRSTVDSGDLEAARSSLRSAQRDAQSADARVTGPLWSPLWSLYGHLPGVGTPVREARGIVEATHAVAGLALPGLLSTVDGGGGWQGHADLTAVRRLEGPLSRADDTLTQVRHDVAGLPVSHVAFLDKARDELAGQVYGLALDVRDATVAARVLPTVLGADHPSHLLVVTQNLAEERATGGLVGAFALVTADRGRLTLTRSGTDTTPFDSPTPVVDLGRDFTSRYGEAQAAGTWRSANLTPHTPSAGAILAGLSATRLHQPVDAVVFVDPVALGLVLRATGPLQVQGLGTMSADNAPSLLLRDVYARYPGLAEQPNRKEALRRAFDAVVKRLQSPVAGRRLVRELSRASSSGHLQLYVTDPALQAEVARARFGGALPDRGPFLSVITQDVGGSKLDLYLRREVAYVATPSPAAVDLGVGPETEEAATVVVKLRNVAPPGLPPYVTARSDAPDGRPRPPGQLKTWLSIYLGPRSSYLSATLNGTPVALASQVEQGLTVLSTYVSIDPGQAATLVVQVRQPAPLGSALVWRQQPRLVADRLTVRRGGTRLAYTPVYDLS